MINLVRHPDDETRLGDILAANLAREKWTHFRAAVAFAKRSGVKHIAKPLTKFSLTGVAKISVGIDQGVTSAEGVQDLLTATGSNGELWIFHNEASNSPTFHPKVYLFSNDTAAECIIGSGNLTEGGLFTNYEALIHLGLDRSKIEDRKLLTQIEGMLDQWVNPASGLALKVTAELIAELNKTGDLPSEAEINIRKRLQEADATVAPAASAPIKKLFAAVAVRPAPRMSIVPTRPAPPAESSGSPTEPVVVAATRKRGFVITLQTTDVGVGQTTRGTSKRSPELFLPKVCVHANPEFWGWPTQFKRDPNWTGPIDRDGFGKMDREGVRMRLGTETRSVNWWYNPDKKDFRLRSEALRSAGNVGDILRIERSDGKAGFDYYVEVIPQGTTLFDEYAALCIQPVRNSKKKYGYY